MEVAVCTQPTGTLAADLWVAAAVAGRRQKAVAPGEMGSGSGVGGRSVQRKNLWAIVAALVAVVSGEKTSGPQQPMLAVARVTATAVRASSQGICCEGRAGKIPKPYGAIVL